MPATWTRWPRPLERRSPSTSSPTAEGAWSARELAERRRDGALRVRSLMLAGTPNLGTPLANDANVLSCINRLTNLLTLVPNPVAGVADAVVAVLSEILGPAGGQLPGITAMRPPAAASPDAAGAETTYLGELNALGRAPGVTYRFIGSDYRPDRDSKLGHAFDGWVLDSVLPDTGNDLVVPLASAVGGAAATSAAGDVLTVQDAPHTGYWQSPEVTRHLEAWLLGPPGPAMTTTMSPPPTEAQPSATADPAAASTAPPAPTIPTDSSPATAPPALSDSPPATAPPAPSAPPESAEAGASTAAPLTAPVLVGPPPQPAQPDAEPSDRAGQADPALPPDAGADAGDASPTPLVVGIRHASLEHAPYPLLVGHFAGAPMTGAEARLDERLGGRLTRLQLLGQTPRQLGESLFLLPADDATPRGVVVVGLGPTGELTGTELSAVVTRALLKMIADHLELRLADEQLQAKAVAEGPPHDAIGVSSVLIGSSFGGGLTVEGSVRAVLGGVTAANERLRRLRVAIGGATVPATDVIRIARLELVERYADRVDLVASALARLADLEQRRRDGRPPRVLFVPGPVIGEGASNSNPPLDAAEEVWRRVGISALRPDPAGDATLDPTARTATDVAPGSGLQIAPGLGPAAQLTLRFTSMGRLARAERLVSVIEPALVQPLIDDAISRDADPDVSGTLFELLVPDLLKGELNGGENIHLLLDNTTAEYPWELLATRADDQNPQVPLALRVGVLRQFLESEDLRHNIRRAGGDSMLVVGNPPPGPGLHPLPAAAREAAAVAALFNERAPAWHVEPMVWDEQGKQVLPTDRTLDHEPGEHVLHRLLNGDWRIVHVAAHGQITADPATTGVVMGGRFHLTANVFARLSVVPDLVFLNACHLGTIAPPRPPGHEPGGRRGGRSAPAHRRQSGHRRGLGRQRHRRQRVRPGAVRRAADRAAPRRCRDDGAHRGQAGRPPGADVGCVPVLRRSRVPPRGPHPDRPRHTSGDQG